jgi:protein-S-isoprenylcysteine O-methyltransferase Ste14
LLIAHCKLLIYFKIVSVNLQFAISNLQSFGLYIMSLMKVRPFERVFVWLGGIVFVGSLGFCAYSYTVRWSMPHRWDTSALALDVVLFSMFAIHHSVFARTRVKDWLSRLVPERLLRSVYVWIASLLLVAVCAAWMPIGGEVYRHAGWLGVPHALVQLVGIWLIARSVSTIDALDLAGIRRQSAGEGLQIVGPYRLVRHPLYLGWLIAVFGAAVMTGDRLAFAAITTASLVIAIPWEERSLRAAFGGEYERYTHLVRWRLVPYVF